MLAHSHFQSGTMSRAMPQSQPQRLQHIEGDWRLEMEQLVYGGPTLLRPRRFEIRGRQAILQYLREQGDQDALAMEAERLFSEDMPGTHTYIVRENAWAPLNAEIDLAPADAQSGRSSVEIAPVLEQLKRCEKRIATLELTVKELRTRLQALSESGISAPVNQERERDPEPEPEPEPERERARARDHEPERERERENHQQPQASRGGPQRAAIGLPEASVLGDLIRSLAGAETSLMPLDDPSWGEGGGPAFCSILNNDAGDEFGAIVLEFESAVRLAAALLMESAEKVDTVLQEEKMTEDLLDAASEVCNTIAASFNKVSGNPHLRAAKLTKLEGSGPGWLSAARGQVGYRHSQGGKLILLAR
jgi:hypothetical protein